MGVGIKFIIALGAFGITAIVGILAWPRLTDEPRPKIVQDIRDAVVQTQLGSQVAAVLGVQDEQHVTPVNISSLSASVVSSVQEAIAGRIRTVVVHQAVTQLMNQYNGLSTSEQQQIQEALCRSPED